jgi:N-acylneuraminate cytidylyltransferase
MIGNIKTIILARGGSKGIPKKNIANINGYPLIYYTIKSALSSLANDVWVSTDCPQIGSIAKQFGAKVIVRPKEISGDQNKSEEALLHFAENINFDILVFIQPTSPLLLSEDINKGLSMMVDYDSIFSAYREHWIPRWNLDYTPYQWSTGSRPMRQDMQEKFIENGAIYITRKEFLLRSKLRYSGKIGILEMPFSRSFQLDTYDDLKLIEQLL